MGNELSTKKRLGFNYSPAKLVILVIATFFLFGFKLIPIAGLSASGVQVIGILIGAMMLWLSMGVGWTSLYVLFALMTVPELGASKVCSTSFGNSTAILMIYCYMLAACLTKSGFARRIAVMLLTNKLSRKNPWNTVLMFLLACFIIGLFLPSSGSILVTLPILDAMLSEVKMEKDKKPAVGVMMSLGSVVAGQLGNGATPISHAMSIQGIGLFKDYTGGSIDFFTFCAVLIPIGVICLILYWLVAKFIWRCDVSSLKNVNFDALKADCGPMTSREKWSAWIYLLVIIFWALPGIIKYVAPSLNPVFSKIGNLYPPLAGLFVMNLITLEDKKPILAFKDALNNVNWGTFIFLGGIMCLGSAVSNKDIGISPWLTAVLSPLFSNVSPALFLFIMVAIGVILTNFVSNAVALAVMMAVAMPLAMGVYGETLNTLVVALLVINAVQHAWATPPGTPSAAVAADYGWLDMGNMFKWGMIVALIDILVIYFVGTGLGALVC